MKKIYYFFIPLIVCIAKMVPFNWIIGSESTFFSYSSVLAPVLAKYCGFISLLYFFMTTKLSFSMSFFMHVLHRLPLICAARAYMKRCFWVSVCVPIACMALFMMHPQGAGAWFYTLYWLIPPSLYFVHQTYFFDALRSTFVAHAIGSVIWLYMYNLDTAIWIGLIPVVFAERLLMTFGIVLCEYVVVFSGQASNLIFFRKRSMRV